MELRNWELQPTPDTSAFWFTFSLHTFFFSVYLKMFFQLQILYSKELQKVRCTELS
jgi:hypothetical protein